MDSIKAYEDLKAKAEAARLKAVEELEGKKKDLLAQVGEIDVQLRSLDAPVSVQEPRSASKASGTGKGAMSEEKRLKLSEAASRRWAEKKAAAK